MVNEIDQYLITKDTGFYVDCTFGGGGHSLFVLNKYKNIKIIAFDQDTDSLKRFNENSDLQKFKDRIIFCHDNFRNIKENLQKLNIEKVNGFLRIWVYRQNSLTIKQEVFLLIPMIFSI